ncbi:GNAT family N-acetyltransferase [Streptomyces aculeolatus]|uniref:GNAT family N-acetyltransferase n=1 Tax=Streptomyces aculeolatus TaxID=270689 RepID=UPI001CEC85F8|nr:GNAT family N-acetyltransferase [Streptomyces aculeolatus]
MSSPVEIAVVRDAAPAAAAWHAVVAAARATDLPGVPAPVREEVLAGLRGDAQAGGRMPPAWAATGAEGEVTAVAGVRPASPGPARTTADLQLYVHPAARRRGTGTLLLAAVAAAAREDGWATLRAAAPACTPADVFCLRHGFVRERVVHHLLLPLAEVHRAWLAELVYTDHPGYRLATWYAPAVPARGTPAAPRTGLTQPAAAPDGLAAAVPGFAFRTDTGAPPPESGRLLTVAALHRDTGAVAGYTEVLIPPAPAPRAQHSHLAVVPAHRRRGLGRWVTAEMLRRLHAEHPQINEVETAAADGEAAVLALGEQLGFRPYRRTHTYRLHLPG